MLSKITQQMLEDFNSEIDEQVYEDDELRSAMVAVFPPEEQSKLIEKYASLEEDYSDLHVTMVYLGKISAKKFAAASRVIKAIAPSIKQVDLGINGSGCFSNEQCVRHLLINGVGFDRVRSRLFDALEEADLIPEQTHGWIPHMTLEYHDYPVLPNGWEQVAYELKDKVGWRCDTIHLCRAGKKQAIPIGNLILSGE